MSLTATQDGIKHLHGNLYRVKTSLINLCDSKVEDGSLTFFNPRHVLAKPKGFSKEEMNELREAIRTEGLENPLLLRWVEIDGNRVLQLASGERRKRCIDKLIKENADCYDPASESWKSASELYDFVDCRINEMDDQTAFKHAFSENERAVGIGEGATVALINEFRKAGWTDEQILETTGKSITWLKDTDILLSLDEFTFKCLVADEINRSAALQLAQIEDIESRVKVLESAKSFASGRISSMKQKLEKEVIAAENKAEFAEAVAVEAEIKGDEEQKTEAEEKSKKHRKRAENKKKEVEELDDAAPKITSKDIHNAKKAKENVDTGESEPSDEGKALTNAKVSKFWYEPLAKIIKANGHDDDGENLEIDLDDARLVIALLDAREAGERDIVSILQDHKLSKGEFIDDDFEDDEEIETEGEEDSDEDSDEVSAELDDDGEYVDYQDDDEDDLIAAADMDEEE